MATTTIYYSVSNGGDGSAYPHFFYDKECADIHQEIVNSGEGWGESCTGSLTIHGENISVERCLFKSEYIKQLQDDFDDELKWEPDSMKEIPPFVANPSETGVIWKWREEAYYEKNTTKARRLHNAIERLKNDGTNSNS